MVLGANAGTPSTGTVLEVRVNGSIATTYGRCDLRRNSVTMPSHQC